MYEESRSNVLVFLLKCLLIFCISIGGGYLGARFAQDTSGNGTNKIIKTTATDKETNNVEVIAASASEAVVEIRTSKISYGSFLQQYVSEGAGSGVIISDDGYIITNNHVVEGSDSIFVKTKDGKEYEATLSGADPNNDIAVIKIKAKNLVVAMIGDSDKLKVGESVIAIGNPLGSLGGTVTEGIISATSRTITIDGVDMTLLQTSAAINPGNSGGGLFNNRGELIGVVNAKSKGEDIEGLGFAIPINTAISIAEEIIENGFVSGNYTLGVTMVEATTKAIARQYGFDETGVYIYEVAKGSDAYKNGLKKGDLLVSVNGVKASGFDAIKNEIKKMKKGNTLVIVVKREGKEITFNIEV